jgi:hypothetical protein
VLIRCFNKFKKIHTNVELVIAGCKYDGSPYFQNLMTELNGNITILENVTDDHLMELYKNCIFSVYPSLFEGFGLPVYYSLWNGRPVICHNQTSTKEISDTINSQWVSSIDCSNEQLLLDEMIKFTNLLSCENIKPIDIYNINIKTWSEYTKEITNYMDRFEEKKVINYELNNLLNNDNPIFICDEVLRNNGYNIRGVGTFTREIIDNYKKYNRVIHDYSEIDDNCKSIIFTHPPPMKNAMNAHEEKTFSFLEHISRNLKIKKIAIIYDIIPSVMIS